MLRILKLLVSVYSLNLSQPIAESIETAYEASTRALFKYQSGDIKGASELFNHYLKKFGSKEIFQSKYLFFLFKNGQYKKILELDGILGEENLAIVEKARKCLEVLESNDTGQIAKLLEVSQHSLEASIAMITLQLRMGNFIAAKQYYISIEKLYPESIELQKLKIRLSLALDDLDEALENLKGYDRRVHGTLSSMNTSLKRIMEIQALNVKLRRLADFYSVVYEQKARNFDEFGFFEELEKRVIKNIVELGCNSGNNVHSFATKLFRMEKNEFSTFYYIKSTILENNYQEASNLLERYSDNLNPNLIQNLRNLINNGIREEQRRRREAEQRRRMQEEERRRQKSRYSFSNQMKSRDAGKDFLKYYETLGITPKATPCQMKSAWRKKMKAASKKTAKMASKKDAQKKGDESIINKAYAILSDPEKKRMYDNGIDPEKGPQMGYSGGRGGGHYQSGAFFNDEQVNNIFETFFGSGGGSSHFIFV
ncbi:hypothetical protein GINT2_000703 [Glugoides intestinalis]